MVSVASALDTVLEECIDETLGYHGLLVYILRVLGGVTKSLEEDSDLALDFGVADNLAEALQTPVR